MILSCPACGTSYVVKDGAIPPQGRQVRCASCKHSWHQDADATVAAAPEPPPAAPPEPQPEPQPEHVEPAMEVAPSAGDVPLPSDADGMPDEAVKHPIPDIPAIPLAQPGDVTFPGDVDIAAPTEDVPELAGDPPAEFTVWNDSGFDGDGEVAPRRKGPLILLLLVLLVAGLAAAAWFYAPRAWLARAGLREASADSPLKLMVTSQDRQKLASGNDLVSLSGRVINPTEQIQPVPPLQADLRDGGGKLVYSWTIAPPAAQLPPRGSASFNAAELGVPPNATSLTLRWAS